MSTVKIGLVEWLVWSEEDKEEDNCRAEWYARPVSGGEKIHINAKHSPYLRFSEILEILKKKVG